VTGGPATGGPVTGGPVRPGGSGGAVRPGLSPAELAGIVLRRTTELAQIPAPPGAEQRRAELVRDWWTADGLQPRIDEAGNVRAAIGDIRNGPGGLLVCAHLDTVFAADAPHQVRAAPGRLTGPSVGDDSVGVAALSAVASLTSSGSAPFWIVATVGEEGMGNLAGIRHTLTHPPGPVTTVIAIEGNYLGRVVITGVGSVRLRVSYTGPGGHAWEQAGAPSAVHAAAAAATAIAGVTVPGARFSVNIGSIGGGEAINARASHAWLEADLRADSMTALEQLEGQARLAIAAAAGDSRTGGLVAEITELGRRPAGSISRSSPLAQAAAAALAAAGIAPEFGAASTDANAAHAAGIPAVALGVTRGAGEHTPAEWIETSGVPAGLAALAATIDEVRGHRLSRGHGVRGRQ
jgi:tripeptide aminopeptidase